MIVSREVARGYLEGFAKLPDQTVLSVLAADLARTVIEQADQRERDIETIRDLVARQDEVLHRIHTGDAGAGPLPGLGRSHNPAPGVKSDIA